MTVGKTPDTGSQQTSLREIARLASLELLDLLDSPRDEGFDRVVQLIKEIFEVEIGIVSLIDAHRQWYKACSGLPFGEVPRNASFCRHVVMTEEPIIVPDASQDPRFADHPAVTGDLHVRFYAGMPLKTRAGHVIGSLCAIDSKPRLFDLRETRILQHLADATMDRIELLQTASSDSLTEALTRRAFKQEADEMILQAQQLRQDIACIVLDIDHFKNVNDTYGHATGDEVLKAVAATCRRTLGADSLLSRFGGEEFAIVVPGADLRDGLDIAESLRTAIAAMTVQTEQGELAVTASFGISTRSAAAGDVETLLSQADAAMYVAKNQGRNCCRTWPSLDTEGSARRRVLRTGFILFGERRNLVDCTVKSLGSDSAGISVFNTEGIPSEFLLQMPGDGTERKCRIVTQDRQTLEVIFL